MNWEDRMFKDMAVFFSESQNYWDSVDTRPVEPVDDPFADDDWTDGDLADPQALLEQTMKEDGHESPED